MGIEGEWREGEWREVRSWLRESSLEMMLSAAWISSREASLSRVPGFWIEVGKMLYFDSRTGIEAELSVL